MDQDLFITGANGLYYTVVNNICSFHINGIKAKNLDTAGKLISANMPKSIAGVSVCAIATYQGTIQASVGMDVGSTSMHYFSNGYDQSNWQYISGAYCIGK